MAVEQDALATSRSQRGSNLVNAKVIRYSDIATCPKRSLLPSHYDEDGSCRCKERTTRLYCRDCRTPIPKGQRRDRCPTDGRLVCTETLAKQQGKKPGSSCSHKHRQGGSEYHYD